MSSTKSHLTFNATLARKHTRPFPSVFVLHILKEIKILGTMLPFMDWCLFDMTSVKIYIYTHIYMTLSVPQPRLMIEA